MDAAADRVRSCRERAPWHNREIVAKHIGDRRLLPQGLMGAVVGTGHGLGATMGFIRSKRCGIRGSKGTNGYTAGGKADAGIAWTWPRKPPPAREGRRRWMVFRLLFCA